MKSNLPMNMASSTIQKTSTKIMNLSTYKKLKSMVVTSVLAACLPFISTAAVAQPTTIEAESYDLASPAAPFEMQSDSGRTVMIWPTNGQGNFSAADGTAGQLFYPVTATAESLTLFATVNFATNGDDSFHYKLDGHDTAWSNQNSVQTTGYAELEITTWSGLNIGQTYLLKIQRREDGAKLDAFRLAGGTFGTAVNDADNDGVVDANDQCANTPAATTVNAQGCPLAQVSQGDIYFVHNDHLGTAQVITDQNQQVVWAANYEPFGAVAVTDNTIDNDSRFPGQYFDAATGLYYNYFRDYDPTIGRYIQSDPIGLGDGVNTYGYVHGNPINYYDPDGNSTVAGGLITLGLSVLIRHQIKKKLKEQLLKPGIGGAAAAGVGAGAGSKDQAEECEDEPEPEPCDPPPAAGTTCSEFHHDSTPHKVFDIDGTLLGKDRNHVHTWRRNKDGSGKCRWNKVKKDTFNYSPIAASPCSSYPSWPYN